MSKERLTIDEIIAHCKRMTQKFEKYNKMDLLENNDMETGMMKEYWEHRQVAKYLEELKQYQELEEQDLLLRLPCKIGDDLYWISDEDEDGNKKMTIRKYGNGIAYITITANKIFLSAEEMPIEADVLGGRYALLTYGEAEEKLRELEGK